MAGYRVTRKGQVTIPQEIRERLSLAEGTAVEFELSGDAVLMRRAASVFDLAGTGSAHATPQEMKRLLERMRAQDA